MLTFVTWWWGDKYPPHYVERLAAGVARHLKQPHRFVCINGTSTRWTNIESVPICRGFDLLDVKGCFIRLQMFDPAWQQLIGVDDRLVCCDLDCVITGPLDPLFDRPEPFVILQGANAANPCPYNGSLMMLRAGAHPEVWGDFNLDAARAVPYYEFSDDQAWLAHMVPNAAGWKAGRESGVYAYKKPGWPSGDDLPADAAMVTFPGWRSPAKFQHLPWVRKHWGWDA